MTEKSPRTWCITGASSGLGRALAACVLAEGDTVAATFRKAADKDAFEAQAPGRARGYLLDVTDPDAVAATATAIEAETGGVDILVNNAGYGLVGPIEEARPEEIRAQFETNVFGPIAVIQAFLPAMRKRRAGHIINITSVSGLAPWSGTGIYGASKYAMECIGQTLAQEVGALGIKVTNVEPGGLRTDFATRSLHTTAHDIADYAETAHMAREILSGHGGEESGSPEKAAAAIYSIAGIETPPLHLLLGADALKYAGGKIGSFQAEISKWAPVTLSIAYDAEESGE